MSLNHDFRSTFDAVMDQFDMPAENREIAWDSYKRENWAISDRARMIYRQLYWSRPPFTSSLP